MKITTLNKGDYTSKDRKLRMLITGQTGVGKSYMALKFHEYLYPKESALVLDFENRLKVLSNYFDKIDCIQINNVSEATEIFKKIKELSIPYKTVIIDSLSFYDYLLQATRNPFPNNKLENTKTNSLELMDWNVIRYLMKTAMTSIFELDKHIIAISQVRVDDHYNQIVDTGKNIPFWFDSILHLDFDEKGDRILRIKKDAWGIKIGTMLKASPESVFKLWEATMPIVESTNKKIPEKEPKPEKPKNENPKAVDGKLEKLYSELKEFSKGAIKAFLKKNHSVESSKELTDQQIDDILSSIEDVKKDIKDVEDKMEQDKHNNEE